jgi:hypothetical protein
MEKVDFKQSRDFGQLVNDTFVFVKQNWKPLGKALFIICGFFIAVGMVVNVFNQVRIFGEIGTTQPRVGNILGPLYFLNILFSIASYTLIGLTTFSYISLYIEKNGTSPSTEEVWSYVKYYFWRFLGSQIALGILVMIGFVLCGIPGIYLFPIVMIMQAMIIFENASLGYVFDRGFKLIKENWWTTFGAFVIIGIAVYALFMLLVLPLSIVTGASMAVSKSGTPLPFVILMSVLGHALQIVTALFYIVTAFAYYSLVEKKEGASLLDKVNTIGQNDIDSDQPEEQY